MKQVTQKQTIEQPDSASVVIPQLNLLTPTTTKQQSGVVGAPIAIPWGLPGVDIAKSGARQVTMTTRMESYEAMRSFMHEQLTAFEAAYYSYVIIFGIDRLEADKMTDAEREALKNIVDRAHFDLNDH